MAARICTYCREKIHPLAVVCRFCGRDLPPLSPSRGRSRSWLPAFFLAAATLAGGALLAAEFFRERRNWLE
ncbi:hypothetical protein ACHHRT_07250 [Desulfurivibrio sp. D14AmB]|uniref:hypothetical protein n=1 Tax=Desulfurivibrio sp. D14AmB TaxID=3374370 RepID=UPI00376EE7DF